VQRFKLKRVLAIAAAAIVLVFGAPLVLAYLFATPSAERDWSPDQAVLARASIAGDAVTIEDVRNFNYRSATDYDARYETRRYDLSRLDSLWFAVERFGDAPAIAHTFLSFGFGDEYVAISVEIRKERGETYSPLRGMLRKYELMYVIGDERDVIGLRTNYRRDPVYLYPARASPQQIRQIFVQMLARANQLAREPEFYNTLTNNCTSNIVRHVNVIAPTIPFGYRVLMPAYSDSLAYDLGLIPNERPIEEVRAAYRIDARAQRSGTGPDFSHVIRARSDATAVR
jgi:hypothetical protein